MKRAKMSRRKKYGAHESPGTQSKYQVKQKQKLGRGPINPNWQSWSERKDVE